MKFDTPATTNPIDQLKVIGQPVSRIDGPRKTTGTATYAYEWHDVAPNPALPAQVVLSSCDVGQTDDRPGGEPLGLVAALVRSGVPTVISGTSKISDTVAEATMVGYHERLIDGATPATALAEAVAAAGSDSGLPAPFSCFGAGL
jgi:xanthine dehydrogenase YagR molybdenum-binding subunit